MEINANMDSILHAGNKSRLSHPEIQTEFSIPEEVNILSVK